MPEETQQPPEKQSPPAEETPAEQLEQATEPAEETAEAAEDKLPKNQVTVEDAGTLRKKITVEVPRERIEAKFDEMFGELNRTAHVPGFRIGRAPRRLIEKRFGKEVAEDVRNAMVGEAVGAALEEAQFKAIGEPEIKLDEIKLPDEGPLTFSLEVEVAPEFELPEYKGVEIKRPVVRVTDEHVETALGDFRRRYGKLRPVDGPAAEGDTVVADVSIRGDGVESKAVNQELRVAPGSLTGIPLEDLGRTLAGKKAGARCRLKTKVPAGHPTENWRDKEVTISFKIQEVKRLELPVLDEAFAAQAGFASVQAMRDSVRAGLQHRMSLEQSRLMREQVRRFLLESTPLEVPENLAQRHTVRLLQRRAVELMLRGVPRDDIERNLEQLEKQASELAARQLKLAFIMGKLAETEGIEVDDAEVNARIAQLARQYNRRPERVRQEMRNEGTFDELIVAMREEKAVDKVLESARITDVTDDQAEPSQQQDESAGTQKPRGKAAGKSGKAIKRPK